MHRPISVIEIFDGPTDCQCGRNLWKERGTDELLVYNTGGNLDHTP
jgi:hypothetical protein